MMLQKDSCSVAFAGRSTSSSAGNTTRLHVNTCLKALFIGLAPTIEIDLGVDYRAVCTPTRPAIGGSTERFRKSFERFPRGLNRMRVDGLADEDQAHPLR